MNRIDIFQAFRSGRFSALVALVGLGLLFTTSGAKAAGCALPYKAGATPSIPLLSPPGSASLNHQEDEDSNKPASIVGLWHVIYTATSASGPFPPTPFEFNSSYKMWHGDGTEFENVGLPPVGGNICYGVWKKLPNGSVKLHHIGQIFDPVTGKLANIFTVDEVNTVDHKGKTYSGYFDFKMYEPTDTFGTGTPLAEVKGTTAATRISVD